MLIFFKGKTHDGYRILKLHLSNYLNDTDINIRIKMCKLVKSNTYKNIFSSYEVVQEI